MIAAASEPRTVLHLVTVPNVGGTERQLLELLRATDRRRWRPRIACFRPEGALADAFRALGAPPVPFPLRGSLLRPNTLAVIARLARHLRRERAALLHCHDVYAILVGVPAARLAGVPTIAARRDLAHHVGPLHRAALRRALAGATRVLANAHAVAAQAEREDGVPARRLAVIPNGLDLARFDELRRASPSGPAPGPRAVLTVARMTHPCKGHDDLLEAIPLVRRQAPDLRFAVVGDGVREPEVRARARALGVDGAVEFLGRRADVPALLARAAIVCHPSRAEGCPNAVLEAMAAARPVVATDAGGTPELIRDGEHGLLVPASDPPALARAILALASDPPRAARMAAAARARVEREFTVERLVERTEALWGSVVLS